MPSRHLGRKGRDHQHGLRGSGFHNSASNSQSSLKLYSHKYLLLLHLSLTGVQVSPFSGSNLSTAILDCLLYLYCRGRYIVPVQRHHCMFSHDLLPLPSSDLVRQPVASRTTACILPHHGSSTQEGFSCTPKTG